jgi:hypothetical protein
MSNYYCNNCSTSHDNHSILANISGTACIESMPVLESLADIRKSLKPLGFTVKTKKLSWGRHATYVRISDKAEMPMMFTAETLEEWKPLIAWRKDYRDDLKQVRNNEDCLGLV